MNKFDKKIHRTQQNRYFGEEVHDYKDGSGLQFKIDFWTGCPEIKAAILVKF